MVVMREDIYVLYGEVFTVCCYKSIARSHCCVHFYNKRSVFPRRNCLSQGNCRRNAILIIILWEIMTVVMSIRNIFTKCICSVCVIIITSENILWTHRWRFSDVESGTFSGVFGNENIAFEMLYWW